MKKVSLVQVNFQQGPVNCMSFYLPYSVGCIWSYANSFPSINQNFCLDHVLWRRDPIEQTAQLLKNQDIIGFSSYVWNKNYNYTLAKRVKELNPNCFIVFGGPEPAITDKNYFNSHPYINAVVKHEGELVFKLLLENINNPLQVPGLLVNINGSTVDTGESERITDLNVLPSPYLTGFFDSIIANAPEVKEWATTLETNRGCPYQCTYCDWGSLTYSKVKKFDIQRVMLEIEWMAKNKIYFMSITDANFGMFVERDNAIIDHYLDMQQKYGFPKTYTASYAKNQNQDVTNIVDKIVKKSTNPVHGISLSLQTLNDNVLEIVRRKNIKTTNVKEIFSDADSRGIPVSTELIIGLPGETVESWKNNFWQLFDANCHSGIDVHFNQFLENAEQNLVQKELYKIETKEVYDYFNLAAEDTSNIKESLTIVRSTDTMPQDQLIDAIIFSWFITTFHENGFSNFIARYLNKNNIADYETFYTSLWLNLQKDYWFSKELEGVRTLYLRWYAFGEIDNEQVSGARIYGWNLLYKTVMEIQSSPILHRHVLDLVQNVANQYSMPDHHRQALYRLQDNYPVCYYRINQYPYTLEFETNIYEHIVNNTPSVDTNTQLTFNFLENKNIELSEYLERLYYGRRRNFGKTWISK